MRINQEKFSWEDVHGLKVSPHTAYSFQGEKE